MRRVAFMVLAACGGSGAFTLNAPDNDPAALARALAAEKPPAPGPRSGRPMAFLVTQDGKLVGWDLAARVAAFAVAANISSRVAVGDGIVVAREGDALAARDAGDGRVRWTHRLPAKATLLGLAADGERAFYVVKEAERYHLVAVAGGKEAWRSSADGSLGAPAARGGLVFMPFLNQWLTLLDAANGRTLARIRLTDEALSYVRAGADGVAFGSRGVFVLDDKAAAGSQRGATYLAASLPALGKYPYHLDAYNAAAVHYSALDRMRLLWRLDGKVFADNLVTLFHYRYLFGFEATSGGLRWAYAEPRGDLVAAEDTGAAIVAITQAGDVVALDRSTAEVLDRAPTGSRVLGATIDADGFRAAGKGPRSSPAEVLAAVIADRDARFPAVKVFALETLGRLTGPDVTAAIIRVLRDEASPTELRDRAAEVLVGRKDETGLPALLEALAAHTDFLTGTYPRAVDVLARAVAALGRVEAAPALVAHLNDPATPLGVVEEVVRALVAIQARDSVPELRSYLLLYRCDPRYERDAQVLGSVIDALLALGGGAGRETVAYTAEEPRTVRAVAERARKALGD